MPQGHSHATTQQKLLLLSEGCRREEKTVSKDPKMSNAKNVDGRLLDPQSMILSVAVVAPATGTARPALCECDPALLSRIRWRCRRGLLELDIVLGRFIEARYAKLSESERQIFEEFLDMPDNPLWDMISDRQDAVSAEQTALLEKIRSV